MIKLVNALRNITNVKYFFNHTTTVTAQLRKNRLPIIKNEHEYTL